MSYRSLEIYQLADDLVIKIHEMTLNDLPGFEIYETGSQIRRSIKSVKSNIVEGYGRRSYKQDFIHFLIFAHASLDETIDHLETLFKTKSLRDFEWYENPILRVKNKPDPILVSRIKKEQQPFKPGLLFFFKSAKLLIIRDELLPPDKHLHRRHNRCKLQDQSCRYHPQK